MKLTRCVPGALIVLVGLVCPALGQTAGPAPDGGLSFIRNGGQWPQAVRSSVRAGALSAWFERDGWVLSTWEGLGAGAGAGSGAGPEAGLADDLGAGLVGLSPNCPTPYEGALASGSESGVAGDAVVGRGVAVRLRFLGVDPGAPLVAEQLRPGRHHDLRGDDSTRWARDLELAARQRWVGAYPGIDVVTFGDAGRLRYDLHLAAGADLSAVAVAVEGALSLSIDEAGALLIETELGLLRQPAPITWNTDEGGAIWPVACAFRLLGDELFGFAAPDADPAAPLVVDPTLEWATYLGGGNIDYVFDSALDADGRLLATGFTASADYPTTVGSFDVSFAGSRDVFVSALEADGATLAFSTLLGGFGNDEGRALDVASDGRILVGGLSASANYPTAGAAFGDSFTGGGPLTGSDGFVSLLSPDGSTLLMSAFVGGSQDDYITDVAFGPDAIHFVGLTNSSDLPVTPGAFDVSYNGGPGAGDGFFGALDDLGLALERLSYLGGGADDVLNAVLADADGRVTVAGWSASSNYPTTQGALQPALGGFADAVVTSFDADGSLLLSTYLGAESDENALDVSRDGDGRLVLGGTTRSYTFPVTAGAVSSSQSGGLFSGDGFVSLVSADGRALAYSTYLGGSADEAVNRVSPVAGGLLAVLAQTASANLPVTPDALDASLGGNLDAVLALIDPAAGELVYSSYLGGSESDRAWDLQVDGGAVVLAGYTTSSDLPVTDNAYDQDFGGSSSFITDGWVARVDLGLASAQAGTFTDVGFAVSGSMGLPAMENQGSLAPLVGGEMVVRDLLPGTTGLFVVSGDAGYYPTHGGVLVPYPVMVTIPFRTSSSGAVSFPYLNPGYLPSATAFYAQAWVIDDAGPKGWAATNALEAIVP